MVRRCGLALVLLLVPALAQAQDKDSPEQLLPASTQVYARWDGMKANRQDFDKTALGKMLKGEVGKFIDSAMKQLQDSLTTALTLQELLGGVPPDQLEKMQKQVAQISKLPGMLADHGFILAGEVRSVNPPATQMAIIIPGGGEKPEPILGLLQLIATMSKVEVKETKLDKTTISTMAIEGGVNVGWWVEGKHFVLLATSDKVEDVAKKMRGGEGERLASHRLYKKVTGFKDYPTTARAFIDMTALVKVGSGAHPDAPKVIELLGLESLQSATFVSGFEDEAERGMMELETKGQRKGLLSLLSSKPFKLDEVPPLPTDVVSWSATSFNIAEAYDTILEASQSIAKLFDPNAADEIKKVIDQADEALGINIRKDLLGNLGDRFVTYTAPSDGLFSLGQVYMVKVKDGDKLRESLDTAIKSAGKLGGLDLTIRKKKYNDIDLHEVHVRTEGFIFLPTYAFYKDWIVFAYYPQPVKAFVLRTKGELAAWKPDTQTKASLDKLPQEFTSVSMTDPRPGLKLVLSLAPLGAQALQSFNKDIDIDVGALPPTESVTRHLFPNVNVSTDDGKVLRYHSRSSLAFPADLMSLETQFLLGFFFSFAGRAF